MKKTISIIIGISCITTGLFAQKNSSLNLKKGQKDLFNNNYSLTNTVTGVKMNITQMGQEMNFDSEKKEDIDVPIGSALKEYINQPKKVVMDKSGKLIPQKTDDTTQETNMVAK